MREEEESICKKKKDLRESEERRCKKKKRDGED